MTGSVLDIAQAGTSIQTERDEGMAKVVRVKARRLGWDRNPGKSAQSAPYGWLVEPSAR